MFCVLIYILLKAGMEGIVQRSSVLERILQLILEALKSQLSTSEQKAQPSDTASYCYTVHQLMNKETLVWKECRHPGFRIIYKMCSL